MNHRAIFLAICITALPFGVDAGPKEDAQAVFGKFLTSFSAANADGILELFAQDALFWGTGSKTLVTSPEGIRQYFSGLNKRAAGVVVATSLGTSSIVLSDTEVLISGIWQVRRVAEDKLTPLRVSLVVGKRGDRWEILQFHNSRVPD